jgi:cobalt/nickel transport system permease protein
MCQHDSIPSWLLKPAQNLPIKSSNRLNFLRKTIQHISAIFSNELYLSLEANKAGFLQQIDPRCKFIVLLSFILITNFAQSFGLLGILFIISCLYAKLSKILIWRLVKRVWLVIPLFLLICSIPALFNQVVVGKELVVVLTANPLRSIFPNGLYISDNGAQTVGLLFLRSGISLSFAYVLMVTTPWHDLTKGLSLLKVPVGFILILEMTYRYIFLLSNLALQMSEARFLRSIGKLSHRENRRFLGHAIALLFIKANYLATEIFSAMRLRGYTHKVVSLKTLRLRVTDWIFLVNNLLILIVLFILTRG